MSPRRDIDDNPSFLAHIEKLEARSDNIESRLSVIEKRFDAGMKSVSDKIDSLVRTVAGQPRYAVSEVLDVIVKSAVLLGMCASAIIWISTSIAAGPVAELRTEMKHEREDIRRIERILENLAAQRLAEMRK